MNHRSVQQFPHSHCSNPIFLPSHFSAISFFCHRIFLPSHFFAIAFFCHRIFLPSHFSAIAFFCHRIFLPFLFLPISDSENEEGQRFFAGLLAGGPWRRGTLADSPTHSLKLYREAPLTGN